MRFYDSAPLTAPLDEITSWLNPSRGRRMSVPSLLSLVQCLSDVEGWTQDVRVSDPRHADGWFSTMNDLTTAIASVGPGLTTALPQLPELTRIARDFRINGAAVPPLPTIVAIGQLVTGSLETMRGPSALRAAFMDVVRSCGQLRHSGSRIAAQRDLLADMMRNAGLDEQSALQNLVYKLDGSWSEIFESSAPVDDTRAPDNDRIRDAEQYIGERPHSAHQVVWLFFSPATLHGWRTQFGPLTLFNAQSLVPGDYGHSDVENWPPELGDSTLKSLTSCFDSADTVAVRVDLGVRSDGDAIRRAQDLAQAMVTVGQFSSSTQHWKQTGKLLYFEDLHLRARHGATGRDIYSYHQDHVVASLDEIRLPLLKHLPAPTKEFDEIVRAARWWQDSRDSSELPRILLDVRLLEFIGSRVHYGDWQKFMHRYLHKAWVWHALGLEVRAVADIIQDPKNAKDEEAVASLQALAEQVATYSVGNDLSPMVTVNHRFIVESLPAAQKLIRDNSVAARTVRDAIKWTRNTSSARSKVESLDAEWRQSVSRLGRVRNSLAHGGPVTTPAVLSVLPFADAMSSWAVDIALKAALEEEPLRDAFDRYGASMDSLRSRLLSSSSVQVGLFGDS
jgi:hypothetical protein